MVKLMQPCVCGLYQRFINRSIKDNTYEGQNHFYIRGVRVYYTFNALNKPCINGELGKAEQDTDFESIDEKDAKVSKIFVVSYI